MMMIFLFQNYGVDIPRSHSCRSAVEDLADMRQHWLVSLSLSLSHKSRSWSPEAMASYKTSQSQASLWRTLDMSFSSSLLLLQSFLLLQLFWDTLRGPKDTDTSLELLLVFVRAECGEQRKTITYKLELCTWCFSSEDGLYLEPKHAQAVPISTQNLQSTCNLSQESKLLVTLWADHSRYCAAPALETKAFLQIWSLQIAAASKFCGTQDRLLPLLWWPIVCKPQLQSSKMCKIDLQLPSMTAAKQMFATTIAEEQYVQMMCKLLPLWNKKFATTICRVANAADDVGMEMGRSVCCCNLRTRYSLTWASLPAVA
jgi:hypothetical protein